MCFLSLQRELALGEEHLALGGTGRLGRQLGGVELAADGARLLGAQVDWLVLLALLFHQLLVTGID